MKKLLTLFALAFSINVHAQYNINTIAGTGNPGFTGNGGQATAADIYNPYGLAYDKNGNLFFADYHNHAVRKITPSGVITTIAGSMPGYWGDGGPAVNAFLYYPYDVAFDKIGNLYISEWGNFIIRKIDTNGIISTFAGVNTPGFSGDGGPAIAAQFGTVNGIACDTAGNVYVVDQNNFRIRKIDTNGIINTIAGIGVGAGITPDGTPAINAILNYPNDVVCDLAGNVYVSEWFVGKINKIDTAGIFTTYAGTNFSGYSGDGGLATLAQLNKPAGINFDAAGNLYIADSGNNLIRKVSTSGIITTIAGTGAPVFSGDGSLATSAGINNPQGVIVDPAGHIVIADTDNNRIRELFKVGAALDFPGNNTTCHAGGVGTLINNFTVEARVKWDGISTAGVIFTHGQFVTNGYSLFANYGVISTIGLFVGNSNISSTAQLTPNVWQMISVVRNAGVWSIYLDGVQLSITNNTLSPNTLSPFDFFIIGSHHVGGDGFGGAYDEFRYWNRPLCQQEIQSRLTCSPTKTTPGLVAFYDFNQGTADQNNTTIPSLVDSSGNGHNLTFTNFALNGTTSNFIAPTGTLSGKCSSFIPAQPSITTTGATNFCAGDSVLLTSTVGDAYTWSNGLHTQSIVVKTPGKDSVTVTNPDGCYGTRTSTAVNITVSTTSTPSICMVTVDDSSKNNLIYWDKTLYPDAVEFYVYRDTANNDYAVVGTISKDSLSQYIDTARHIGLVNGDPNIGTYRYKLAYKDTCGNISPKSPWHNTVYTLAFGGGTFNYNHYGIEGQPDPVPGLSTYSLLRDNFATGTYVVASSIGASSTIINDPSYNTYQNTADWRVVTNWTTTCTPSMKLGDGTMVTVTKSRSNIRNNRVAGIKTYASSIAKIYPNPSNNEFKVELSNNCNNCKIEIINMLGATVRTLNINTAQSTVNTSDLENGIYYIKISSNNKPAALQKLVVQH